MTAKAFIQDTKAGPIILVRGDVARDEANELRVMVKDAFDKGLQEGYRQGRAYQQTAKEANS